MISDCAGTVGTAKGRNRCTSASRTTKYRLELRASGLAMESVMASTGTLRIWASETRKGVGETTGRSALFGEYWCGRCQVRCRFERGHSAIDLMRFGVGCEASTATRGWAGALGAAGPWHTRGRSQDTSSDRFRVYNRDDNRPAGDQWRRTHRSEAELQRLIHAIATPRHSRAGKAGAVAAR